MTMPNKLTGSYSTESIPGHKAYKLSGMLQHYLSLRVNTSPEEIADILQKVDYYSEQLLQLKRQGFNPAIAGHKALDEIFSSIPDDNKKPIRCKAGCTGCCHIELHISADEARLIADYCMQNGLDPDKSYLEAQIKTGRKEFSAVSRCVFLKDNLCSIYEVRPAACRKHFVKSDPAFCDSSKNTNARPDTFFDLHSEIVASAILNISETDSIEALLLNELNNGGK